MTTTNTSTSGCAVCGGALTSKDDICCAQQQTVYHCGTCDTNRVAFAVALGHCETCGGALTEQRPAGTTLDDQAMQAVRRACEIELGGAAFYAAAAEMTTDPAAVKLLTQLRDIEGQHLAELEQRFHIKLEPPTRNAVSLAALVVYGHTDPPLDSTAILKLAAELERRARDFFAEQASALPVGSRARALYAEFQEDEAEHLRMLNELMSR